MLKQSKAVAMLKTKEAIFYKKKELEKVMMFIKDCIEKKNIIIIISLVIVFIIFFPLLLENCAIFTRGYSSSTQDFIKYLIAMMAIFLAIWRSNVADKHAKIADKQTKILVENQIIQVKEKEIYLYKEGSQMLSHKDELVRQAGIRLLNNLAEVNPKEYHWPVTRTLCDLLRKKDSHDYLNSRHDIIEIIAFVPWRERGDDIPTKDDLARLNLKGANLQNLTIIGRDLRYADLNNANLTCIQIQSISNRPVLDGSVMLDADLYNATISNANLSNANFHYAKGLETANFDTSWFSPEHLPPIGLPDNIMKILRKNNKIKQDA